MGILEGFALGAGIGELVGYRLGSSVGLGVLGVGANEDVGCVDGSTDGDDDEGSTDGVSMGALLGGSVGNIDDEGTGASDGDGTG